VGNPQGGLVEHPYFSYSYRRFMNGHIAKGRLLMLYEFSIINYKFIKYKK